MRLPCSAQHAFGSEQYRHEYIRTATMLRVARPDQSIVPKLMILG